MTEIKYKNVFLGWEHDEFDFRGVKLKVLRGPIETS